MSTPDAGQNPELKKKLSFKVFGVGGAGCNAAMFLARAEMPGVGFYAINTDSQALEQFSPEHKWVLGARRTRGLGAGGDPEVGRSAAEDDLAKLRELCADTDMIFVVAGLGGGTGGGASPVLAQVAKESGALVMAVVTLPFEFEGTRRQRQAQLGLQQLKASADAVICLPNQKLFKLIDENTSVLEAFKISNGFIADGVRGIWRLLTHAGLINVDFADLCSVTRGRHAESSFATAEASGDKRSDLVMEKLLAHPLLDGGQILGDSDAVLVSIVGGPDLTMSQINKFMEKLNRQCESAHVIMGAAIDNDFANRLSVTLVASHNQGEELKAAPLPAPLENCVRGAVPSLPASSPQFLDTSESAPRPTSRFVPPPPDLPAEKKEQLFTRQSGGRSRRKMSKLQKELPLEIVSKGRFEKSEPTIRHGEDLDVPTYIRRGVALN